LQNDSAFRNAVLQFGAQVSQPVQPGQNAFGQLTGALSSSVASLSALRDQKKKEASAQKLRQDQFKLRQAQLDEQIRANKATESARAGRAKTQQDQFTITNDRLKNKTRNELRAKTAVAVLGKEVDLEKRRLAAAKFFAKGTLEIDNNPLTVDQPEERAARKVDLRLLTESTFGVALDGFTAKGEPIPLASPDSTGGTVAPPPPPTGQQSAAFVGTTQTDAATRKTLSEQTGVPLSVLDALSQVQAPPPTADPTIGPQVVAQQLVDQIKPLQLEVSQLLALPDKTPADLQRLTELITLLQRPKGELLSLIQQGIVDPASLQ